VRLIQADSDNDLENSRNRGDYGDSWQSERSFNPNSYPPSRSYSGFVDVQMTITAVEDTYATVHFGSFTAWFYSITAEVQDSNGDGFDNEILFTYDPDTDSSSQDIMVQFDFYGADKTGVPYSFYENKTIEGSDSDSFEYEIGYYNGYKNGLWWIEVRLWVGEDMADLKVFGNIWIEYPSPSNNDNEWFESVNWNTLDTTGDGSNNSLVVDFETVSSQFGGTADVYLELYTDENVSSRHSVVRNNIDWGSHSIILDMTETDLPPGILRGNLVLIVDLQREHIASTLNLDMWWDSVRLNNAIASAHDLDEDGTFDSIEVFVNIDHSLRTDTLVMFEVNAWNMTDFDGFASMQETRSIPLGLASEGSSGGRGEQSFWLYAEWNQEVFIEIRAILPNGKEFTTMIDWDELNSEYGFSLQPLDWTVTAWLTDHQLLDSNGDEQQDLFRARYDFDSVSDALDVAVELEVTTPDNSHFSIWDNYTITGDLYDLRSLEFTTWYTGQHEFTLRVHDLSDNKIEFEKSFGQFTLSSGFDPLSLNLTTNFESVTTLGSECQIHAMLNDKIGESYDSVGEIKWFGLPFTPSMSVDILDCSQWPEGTYSVSASYVNGLGLEVESVISVEVVLPPTPPDIVFDLSNVPDLGRDSCEIGINNAIDSTNILTVESYEWYVNGVLSSTTTEKLSCSEFDFGLTYIEIYAYGEGDTFDVEKANIVLNMDPTSPDSNSSVEISLKSNTETESGGLITIAILCLIALIIPAFVFRNRTSDEESNYDIGDAMWLKDIPPHLPSESNMGLQHDNFIPPSRQNQWEEIVDDDGYQWRKYPDGRAEWYDSQTDEWNLYEQ